VDFSLDDEQKMVQQTVRNFVTRELIPLEGQVLLNEREGRHALEREKILELQQKAKKMGFWGINTPEEYGGANLGPIMAAITAMEIGRTFVPFTFGGNADNILYECNAEQKERYLIPTINGDRRSCFALTEPGAGSDAANIKMRAVRDGDHYVLSGEKVFITNGNEADFAMVFAVTDPDKGGHGGITCFLVDREMGWKSSYIPTMGDWGPASLFFENVRVPAKNILGEPGGGFDLGMQWIGAGRWRIPASAVGTAERALQMAIDYSKQRVSMGHLISEYEAIQWMIADSHVEIESTRWLVLYAAWLAENGKDSRHASSVAKLHGANMVNHVIDRVMQIHGGMGYTKELPIERWYRLVRLYRIFEGTDEIQRYIISRNLLKGHVRQGEAF
jgi:acyl-CoA dehydrogenase